MRRISRFCRRVHYLLNRRRFDSELEEEMRFHLEMKARETGDAASAQRALGNLTGFAESTREAWGWRWVEQLAQDVRYAFRALANAPAFTVAAVLCLALGIGATAVVFSLVDGIWTRPLAVRDPSGLVHLYETGSGRDSMSYPDYLDFQAQARCFSGLLAQQRRGPVLKGNGWMYATMTNVVSSNYFDVLGISPEKGRFFRSGDAGSAGEPVVVMSHNLWLRRFGGDPNIVGKSVNLTNRLFAVIGVAPKTFRGTELWIDSDFWIPVESWEALSPGESHDRQMRGFEAIGRLREGVSIQQARAEVAAIARGLASQHPDTNRDCGAMLETDFETRFGNANYAPFYLLGTVGLVLLIACANVANLLLSRSETRRQEIAIRLAIGCGRGRLLRQLLTESAVLAALGGALAVGAAALGIAGLPSLMPPESHLHNAFYLDRRVLAFAAAVSACTALLFGLVPAVRAARKSAPCPARAADGSYGRRVQGRDALVAAQIALSLVLLAGAGLLVRALINMNSADLGFERKEVLVAQVYPPYGGQRAHVFYDELLARVRAMPGVRRAAVASRAPMAGSEGGRTAEAAIPGYQLPEGESKLDVGMSVIGPEYFGVMGTHVLQGREFADSDRAGSRCVVVINQTMAQRFWPGGAALGRVVQTGGRDCEVAGIVQDVRINDVAERPRPYMYVAFAQSRQERMGLLVETAGEALASVPGVRAQIAATDRNAAAIEISTMGLIVRWRTHTQRANAVIVGTLGLLGLALAAIGLYGVVSYTVAQRRREFGVRMAMGAGRKELLALVLKRGLALGLAGCALGLAGALAATRVLAGLLYGVKPRDPLTLATVCAALIAVALAASYFPARRAARTDPVTALRYE